MATILLSAAGAAVGAGFGGAVLGLSGAVIGRAVGATLGRVIDQRLMGAGSETVESGRVERIRLTGAGEGAPLPRLWGRTRLGGHVIWASRFDETRDSHRVGKNGPRIVEFSYSVSLAIALCEGGILGVGRIWADGHEIAPEDLALRIYTGGEDQLPDPLIEAIEGAGRVPAYRGTAYVVIEDLQLEPFGNRVPQFSFEVIRAAQADGPGGLESAVSAVALMPGTGEYALATTPVYLNHGFGRRSAANVNTPSGQSDLATSLDALGRELPGVGSVSLVVSWFGDDLRCGDCAVVPKVESRDADAGGMPWRVAGLSRAEAGEIARRDGRPVYGGTPADASVVEAIAAIHARGHEVMFYPFLLMEQLPGNGLPHPWSDAADQPVLPWRGRITTSVAPGRPGGPDRTTQAEAEVAAFFGAAQPGDFAVNGTEVSYTGPPDTGLRRMILHYAHLCAAAGGVEAFCVGSELRGLTQIRGAGDSFPAVAALRQLAADVRTILGPDCRISYAADWSEYFGYDSPEGNRYFHLDPFWADDDVDFIGIDNYMPLSDWRDGDDHVDAHWGAIHDLDYLKSNIMGGEGYDWYYPSPEARDAQRRVPITDGTHDEPWVFRYKDVRGWWENAHHDRIDGMRAAAPSPWVPRSKPFRFTELGCAAVDKGTNQPNKFLDPKSSESGLPHYSSGRRDDLIQIQYLRAMAQFWADPANNPAAETEAYDGPMVDMARAHVWAWDARPFPQFPGLAELWADGDNWARGHWLTGRAAVQPLSRVVREIGAAAGLAPEAMETGNLHAPVRGFAVDSTDTARAALQPLMLGLGFEALERDGRLVFQMRGQGAWATLLPAEMVEGEDGAAPLQMVRAPEAEIAGRVRLMHIEAEADFETRAAETVLPGEESASVAASELPLVLTRAEGRAVVERWLSEARVARDSARFALPPSAGLGPGDVVRIVPEPAAAPRLYRLDRVALGTALEIEAVRVEPSIYRPSDAVEGRAALRPFAPPVPVTPRFLDLPLITGDEAPHAPHIAVSADPWPGSAALWSAPSDEGYALDLLLPVRAGIGVSESPLLPAPSDRWDRGPALRLRMPGAVLASADAARVLGGANLMAIGDGSAGRWELFQFAEAALMAPDVWEVSTRLRGRFGTERAAPQEGWPPGSSVVMIDGALRQIPLAPAARRVARHYRIGPAGRPHDDPAYTHLVEAFDGVGLRPYAPAHLCAAPRDDGGVSVNWIRRTRIDGDPWEGIDVPLGEASEQYLLRVIAQDAIRREAILPAPGWEYGAAMQQADGVSAPFTIAVAQVSERSGPGPFAEVTVDA
ncbi:host specificity protein [Rhodobacteraceae bacterium WD3A24]|nr:host specificity protein [Rhodobacteraceae bacterium WD3A24]